MSRKITAGLTLLMGVFLTYAYFVTAWHLSAFWSTLVPNHTDIPRLSEVLIKPLPLSIEFGMIHWQLAALFSLIITSIWGFKRLKNATVIETIALPFSIHVAWLLLCLMLHISGLLASVVSVCYSIQ
jgi:hypothetical protein